jgi:hypothetical protein
MVNVWRMLAADSKPSNEERLRMAKPLRSPRYLAWIRSLPCVACGKWSADSRRTEAAHTGPHGLSQKASDLTCIPLCALCHREGPNAIHRGLAAWCEHWRVDIEATVLWLNAAFDAGISDAAERILDQVLDRGVVRA